MSHQPSLIPDQKPDVTEQIAELEREIQQRERVYPRLIQKGTLSQERSDYRIRCLEETIAVLKQLSRLTDFGKRE